MPAKNHYFHFVVNMSPMIYFPKYLSASFAHSPLVLFHKLSRLALGKVIRAHDYFKIALDHLTLASGKKLQAIITESYGPCFWPDHKDVSWEWYKKYNADALRMAAAMSFTGLALSNYSEPLFSLWDDVDWHRNSNLFTLNMLPLI